jgi:TPR repeat protein
MSSSKRGKEPNWLSDWRKAYKKKYGGLDLYTNLYKNDNTPFNYNEFKEYVDLEVSKGNISKDIVARVLKRAKKREETVENVPIYESPHDYSTLKNLSDEIEQAISRVCKVKDDKNNEEDFSFTYSSCIITRRMSELNGGSGPISDSDYFFIEFDSHFNEFIDRIGQISVRLFNVKNEEELDDIKKLFDKNLERDPDIYKYFRDVFFRFMFTEGNLKDENIFKLLVAETFGNLTGFLPMPDLKSDLFFGMGYVILKSIGLFVMGHEYSHIILHYLCNASADINSFVQPYQQEFQADDLALKLMWDCIHREFSQNPHERARARFCFIGVEIFFNCLHIIDRMRGVINGNEGVIVSDSHPPTKARIENIRLDMQRLCEKWGLPNDVNFLDAVDYIFQKLGDHVINELARSEYILASCQSKKKKIEELKNEAAELYKKRDENGFINTDTDLKIISLCKSILSEDPNNIMALFMLGAICLENKQDDEAIEYYMKVIQIAGNDFMDNRPVDMRFFPALYFVGYLYTQKIVAIIHNSNGNPNTDEEKKISRLWDAAIAHFTSAVLNYHHNGMAFFYLGLGYSYKNDHQKAIENFDKALQYQPDNQKIITSRQASIFKLTGFKTKGIDLSSFNINITDKIRAAESGNAKKQTELGIIYESGLGVPADLKKAVYWFNEAAKKGDAQAQYFLGNYYKKGIIVRQDLKEAINLYTKAAKKGFVDAQFDLGILYTNGIDGIVNLNKAFYWYAKAAKKGDAKAQYNVGVFYENGYSKRKNLTKAVYWYTKAAKQGVIDAQYNLSILLRKAGDFQTALYWLQQAADHGDPKARKMLGLGEK